MEAPVAGNAGPDRRADRPLRLGLWCIVQSPVATVTILPNEGIGVFVYNLVNGLLAQESPPEVVLVVRSADHDRVASFLKAPRPNLRILPEPTGTPLWKDPGRLLRACAAASDRFYGWLEGRRQRFDELRRSARFAAMAPLRWLARRVTGRRYRLLALAALPLLPVLVLAAWVLYAPYRLAFTVLRILAVPVVWADQFIHYLSEHPRLASPEVPEIGPVRLVDEADCDVWVIPSIHCNSPRDVPSVLFVHDLVTSHFPEIFDKEFVDRVNRIAPSRAARATLVACMSGFIRDTDLLGIMGLPADKVRMVPSATPVDFPPLTDEEARSLKPAALKRPYLFFPTAFRPYKNHRGLVRALRRLRDYYGVDDFDLVFTGGALGQMPEDVQRLVDAYGLRDRVHVTGGVDRKTLAALYRCAFATLVPSLYEQASYQIAEALHTNCPVACSRIPPFVEQCTPLGGAMEYFDPEDADAIARAVLHLRDNRGAIRERQRAANHVIAGRTWKHAAAEWLRVFHEAAARARQPRPLDDWSRTQLAALGGARPAESDPLEVFLFLPTAYRGGVWESTRNLVAALTEVNRDRRQLNLVLGVHEDQADTESLCRSAPGLRLERLVREEYTLGEARDMLGDGFRYPDSGTRECFCGFRGRGYPALRADAWLALLDRFSLPLLPARPYAVWVYDMIQSHVPEFFGEYFFANWVRPGMTPTLRNAAAVITTSPATARDVAGAYDLDGRQVRLIPLAYEPHRRFGPLLPEPVTLPREPFLLYPANAGGHKGAGVVLRAYARLKVRLGERTPALVQCGTESDAFSKQYRPRPTDPPHWAATRALVADLELEEGRDVVFTGFVNDRQLLDLYQRCGAVINAAKYDNGSYALIEGQYFGRPLVSTDYSGARDLCSRFQLPARFFPVDDDGALAERMEQTLQEAPLTGQALDAARRKLADPEYSLRQHAERVYDLLLDLARQGRHQRLARHSDVVDRRAAA